MATESHAPDDDGADAPDELHLAFALAQHHVDLDAIPDDEWERMLAELRDGGAVETGGGQ